MAEGSSARRMRTWQKIINAFWEVYEVTPYGQITVRLITETAKCNHSTFYEYFENIDDLRSQAQDQFVDEIREYFRVYFGNVCNKNNQVIYDLAADTHSDSAAKLNALFGPVSSFYAKCTETLRPDIIEMFEFESTDATSNFAADMFSACWITTLIIWYQQGKPITEQDLVKLSIGWSTEGIIPTMQELSSSEDDSNNKPNASTDVDETN